MPKPTTRDADDRAALAPSWPGGVTSQRRDEMRSDIRNCLAPILTSAAIARSLSVDDTQLLALDIIERQAIRLSHIVDNALGDELLPGG